MRAFVWTINSKFGRKSVVLVRKFGRKNVVLVQKFGRKSV